MHLERDVGFRDGRRLSVLELPRRRRLLTDTSNPQNDAFIPLLHVRGLRHHRGHRSDPELAHQPGRHHDWQHQPHREGGPGDRAHQRSRSRHRVPLLCEPRTPRRRRPPRRASQPLTRSRRTTTSSSSASASSSASSLRRSGSSSFFCSLVLLDLGFELSALRASSSLRRALELALSTPSPSFFLSSVDLLDDALELLLRLGLRSRRSRPCRTYAPRGGVRPRQARLGLRLLAAPRE